MGTSATLLSKYKNKTKILQYQSMDGGLIPTGKELLKNLHLSNINELKNKIEKLEVYNEKESKEIKNNIYEHSIKEKNIKPLLLSIPEIIEYLDTNDDNNFKLLHYSLEWITYSEYIYILDFDKEKFFIYEYIYDYTSKENIINYNNTIIPKHKKILTSKFKNLIKLKHFIRDLLK